MSQNHRFFNFDKYQPSKKLCFLLFKPKNWVELGRFQNYSIPILNNFGKYSKIDFFTISILKNWDKIVDSSISIKIDPALLFERKELKVTGRKLSIALIAHLLLMFFNFLFTSIVVICHINSIFYKFLNVITKWSRRSNKINWRLTTCTTPFMMFL